MIYNELKYKYISKYFLNQIILVYVYLDEYKIKY